MESKNLVVGINAGSSSVKVSLYRYDGEEDNEVRLQQLADVTVSGLSSLPATLEISRNATGAEPNEQVGKEVNDQESAFALILNRLLADEHLPQLKQKSDICLACHRIVHGGALKHAQVIDERTYHYLEELSELAPLHNASGLAIIHAVRQHLPSTKNMALFDNVFHSTMPTHISSYAIDQGIAQRQGLRKYGFHGISYAFITRSVAAYLQKPLQETNIIALHLGSGASACAIRNGKSLDTSMGLTPLAGLPGGSRSGDVDPSLVFHYTNQAGRDIPSDTQHMHITTAEEILNKKSGFQALTGTSDFGEISRKAEDGDEQCRLAFDLFADRIAGYVGSYFVKLQGQVDALVFAGGIGEKGTALRRHVVEQCASLGFALDQVKNEKPPEAGVVVDLGAAQATRRTLLCRTDEQLEMTRACISRARESRELGFP